MEEGVLGSVGRPEYQSLGGLGFEATENSSDSRNACGMCGKV